MFEIEAVGQWEGDAREHCEELTLRIREVRDAKQLALLNRVLSDPELCERLLEQAERIEAESRDGAALVGCHAFTL